MKRRKKLFALLLAVAMMLGMGSMANAASVIYEDQTITFAAENQLTATDLFEDMKQVMPGDTLEQTIRIINNSEGRIKVWLTAVPHPYEDEAHTEEGFSEIPAKYEDIASMNEFLEQLTMRLYANGEELFVGAPNEAGEYYLGETRGSILLRVELEMPKDLDNEYANRYGEVDWLFQISEYDDEPFVPPYNPVIPPVIPNPPSVIGEGSITVQASKYVDGSEEVEGIYTFVLLDKEGNIVASAQNNGSSIVFEELKYDKAGEYEYYLLEQKGTEELMKYDESIYLLKVSVTEEGGKYVPSIRYEREGIEYEGMPMFNNETIEAEIISPDTGDHSRRMLWLGVMVIGIVAIGYVLISSRRKAREE